MLLSPFGNLSHTSILYYYNIDHRILEYWKQVDSKNKKHVTLISYRVYHLDRVIGFKMLEDKYKEYQPIIQKMVDSFKILPIYGRNVL